MSTVTWMAAAFRKNDLRVRAVQGWKTRSAGGSFSPRGVVFHHTASNEHSGPVPSLAICTNGRSDIPGPLCNVLIGRDGTVHLIAAGQANHAGLGGPFRNIPRDSANAFMIGVEVENSGVGEKWSPELLRTCDVVFATLLLGLRRRSGWLIGHKEWAPTRKIDPFPLDMDKVRSRVRAQIRLIGMDHAHAPATDIHVVKAGDTLFRIALNHRMSVAELQKLNGLTSDLIRVGQELKVR